MSRYIDADRLLQLMGERYDCYNPDVERNRNIRFGIVLVRRIIDKLATVDVQEIVHREWVYNDFDIPHCSECGTEVMPNMISKYCPNCGAKMEEE